MDGANYYIEAVSRLVKWAKTEGLMVVWPTELSTTTTLINRLIDRTLKEGSNLIKLYERANVQASRHPTVWRWRDQWRFSWYSIAYFVVICEFLNSAISSSVVLEHIVVPEEENDEAISRKQPYRSRCWNVWSSKSYANILLPSYDH